MGFLYSFLIYAWFIIIGKLIWYLDFEFINYDGNSLFLKFCVLLGWYGLMTIAMLPISNILCEKDFVKYEMGTLPQQKLKQYFLMSVAIVFFCGMYGSMIFMTIGLIIGIFSEDAANVFLKYTTLMK